MNALKNVVPEWGDGYADALLAAIEEAILLLAFKEEQP